MKKMLIGILVFTLLLMAGCGTSTAKIEEAREQAYREGYEDGFKRGAEAQYEEDCENFLIDGRSIRNIEEQVYEEYGMTPSQAFGIIDEYEYDSTHGGYSWSEYKEAIEVMYYTMSIFPQDY